MTSTYFGRQLLLEPFKFLAQPHQYKIVALQECPTPDAMQLCDTPAKAAEYWRLHIANHPHFNPDCECFAVIFVNTRRKIKGHHIVSIGTLDSVHAHPREVFRLAVMTAAAAIVLAHNHPSGEPQPSDADVRITRDLIRAGQLLKIEVLDHVVVGHSNHCSLREMGFFYD